MIESRDFSTGEQVAYVFAVLGAIWCGLPSVFATLIAIVSTLVYWPDGTREAIDGNFGLYVQFLMGTSIAIASLIVAIANVASHARMRGGRSRSAFSLLLAYAMWGAVYAPVVVHLVLPVEDPYTGDGSPMAALLGAMIFFAIASVFFLPVAIALVVRAHHCTRLRW